MGKISDALDKYRKERKTSQPVPDMRPVDWDTLMHYNKRSGKLNLHRRNIIRDPGTVHRLLANKLILPDGRLTQVGKRKCEAYRKRLRSSLSGEGPNTQTETPPQESANRIISNQEIVRKGEKDTLDIIAFIQETNLSESDLEILMSYDRNTGHLLKYEKDTGNLDSNSLRITRDQGILQRLLNAKMIYPGGKLTPAGIKACAELPRNFKTQPGDTFGLEDQADADRQNRESSAPSGNLRDSDWAALMQYDRDTGNILKYDPKSGKMVSRSREMLRNPETINRLINNKMILPGGWLTKEAKEGCERREKGLKEESSDEGAFKESDVAHIRDIMLIEGEGKVEKRPSSQRPSSAVSSLVNEIDDDNLNQEYEESHAAADKIPEDRSPAIRYQPRPSAHHAIDNNLVALLEPESVEAEQFKTLRTNILFPVSGKSPRSILVTSTTPGEGKSFVSANLAVSIAHDIDRHVLLVDCDLRKPEIHTRFGFGSVPGLTDYLTNGNALSDLLLRTGVNKLTLLPAGKPPSNPSELLSSERMASFIKEVTERYSDRMIILDSPPPRMAAESFVLAGKVDGVILVAKYGGTSRKVFADLISKIGKHKIIGCVFNNFDIRSIKYRYRYYGKYYGKYHGKK